MSKSWEQIVKETEKSMKRRDQHRHSLLGRYVSMLRKLMTIELLVGVTAAFSMYMQFGWEELEKTLLSWIIGLTIAATLVTFMIGRYKKITHIRN